MEDKFLKGIYGKDEIPVPRDFILDDINKFDLDSIKVYLFLLTKENDTDGISIEDIAKPYGLTPEKVKKCVRFLLDHFSNGEKKKDPLVDEKFKEVSQKVSGLIGHLLTPMDAETIDFMMNELAMDPESVILLYNFFSPRGKANPKYMRAVASGLAQRKHLSYKDIEQELRDIKETSEQLSEAGKKASERREMMKGPAPRTDYKQQSNLEMEEVFEELGW